VQTVNFSPSLSPGPITASVPYGLTKWEEDLGSSMLQYETVVRTTSSVAWPL